MRKLRTGRFIPLLVCLFVLLGMTFAFSALAEEGGGAPHFYQTFWSLLPPLIAIALALITKEVYTSLFIGIIAGGLLYSGFSFEGTLTHAFSDGIVASLSDPYNVGILVFLVVLGILVADEQGRRVRRVRPLGLFPDQVPGRRAAGHGRPGRADLYRRLL